MTGAVGSSSIAGMAGEGCDANTLSNQLGLRLAASKWSAMMNVRLMVLLGRRANVKHCRWVSDFAIPSQYGQDTCACACAGCDDLSGRMEGLSDLPNEQLGCFL